MTARKPLVLVSGGSQELPSGDTISGTASAATVLAVPHNIDGQAFDGSTDITVVAPATHAATGKTTPVDADEVPIVDSAASNVLKKLTWANLKATLKTYFDTLYAAVGAAGVIPNDFTNKIINGGHIIDNRNLGAAVTVNTASTFYLTDMWQAQGQASDGVFTVQQIADAPAGLKYSLKATVTTADSSIGAGQSYIVTTKVEGQNCIDLALGTASAAPIALSFSVKSSVTGAFSGALTNSATNRSYPFSYTINSANTWETKTILLTGDTTGSWLTDTGIGLQAIWSLGCGTTGSGTAVTWAASAFRAVTGAVNLIATNSATWQITGVKLENNTAATAYRELPIDELIRRCLRYLPAWNCAAVGAYCPAMAFSITQGQSTLEYKVTPRLAPTGIVTSTASAFNVIDASGSNVALTALVISAASSLENLALTLTVTAGLVAGNATVIKSGSGTTQILATGADL